MSADQPAADFLTLGARSAFAYSGDGTTRVRSEIPAVCRVASGVVRFVGGGTCTLVARASATRLYYRAVGAPQSFVVSPAPPKKPKAGKN